MTNEALNQLAEFPDLRVPVVTDDMMNKRPLDSVQTHKLNRTEFLRQLADFR